VAAVVEHKKKIVVEAPLLRAIALVALKLVILRLNVVAGSFGFFAVVVAHVQCQSRPLAIAHLTPFDFFVVVSFQSRPQLGPNGPFVNNPNAVMRRNDARLTGNDGGVFAVGHGQPWAVPTRKQHVAFAFWRKDSWLASSVCRVWRPAQPNAWCETMPMTLTDCDAVFLVTMGLAVFCLQWWFVVVLVFAVAEMHCCE
jgi:hypothetical protein